MQELPSITVITVCYNAFEELQRTLHSVFEQNYPCLEYIIVDGASIDGTSELLEQYKEHIDLLISERDRGIYDAMNKGLQLATSDYVCFMNAGDTFHSPDTLSEVFGQVDGAFPDVLYGETNIVDETGSFIRRRRLKAPSSLGFESFKQGMVVCHQSFYAKRAIAPLYDLRYKYSSDFDWCLKILRVGGKTMNTHLVLTDYLSEGATTRHRYASLIERARIMCKHYGLFQTVVAHVYFLFRALIYR